MKKTIFKDIHSLEDIHKRKLHLKRRLRTIEKSFSDKSDVVRLLFNASEGLNSLSGETDGKKEIWGLLLPLGIKSVLRFMKNIPDSKLAKRLIIFSTLGGISALLVYQYLNNREKKTES